VCSEFTVHPTVCGAGFQINLPNVKAQKIVVDDKSQLASEAEAIRKTYGDKSIAVLMANAGWAAKGDSFDEKIIDQTLAPNYYGLLVRGSRSSSKRGDAFLWFCFTLTPHCLPLLVRALRTRSTRSCP